jgi:release factor glutamine methyltransferase
MPHTAIRLRRTLGGGLETAICFEWCRQLVGKHIGNPVFTLPYVLLRPPGVYRPQADSWLLIQALYAVAYGAALPRSARILDLFTGTGVLAVAAARSVRLRSRRWTSPGPPHWWPGSTPGFAASRCGSSTGTRWSTRKIGRSTWSWPTRRTCPASGPRRPATAATGLGCGPERPGTARPVVHRRAALLERQGLIEPGQRHEELVVIRGDRPDPAREPGPGRRLRLSQAGGAGMGAHPRPGARFARTAGPPGRIPLPPRSCACGGGLLQGFQGAGQTIGHGRPPAVHSRSSHHLSSAPGEHPGARINEKVRWSRVSGRSPGNRTC